MTLAALALRLVGVDAPLRSPSDETLWYRSATHMSGYIAAGLSERTDFDTTSHPPLGDLLLGVGALAGGLQINENPDTSGLHSSDVDLVALVIRTGASPSDALKELVERSKYVAIEMGREALVAEERRSAILDRGQRMLAADRRQELEPQLEQYFGQEPLRSWEVAPIAPRIVDGSLLIVRLDTGEIVARRSFESPPSDTAPVATLQPHGLEPMIVTIDGAGGLSGWVIPDTLFYAAGATQWERRATALGGQIIDVAGGASHGLARRADGVIVLFGEQGPMGARAAPSGSLRAVDGGWEISADRPIFVQDRTLVGSRVVSALVSSASVPIVVATALLAGLGWPAALVAGAVMILEPSTLITGRMAIYDGMMATAVSLLMMVSVAFYRRRIDGIKGAVLLALSLAVVAGIKLSLWVAAPSLLLLGLRALPRSRWARLIGATAGGVLVYAFATTPGSPWAPALIATAVVLGARTAIQVRSGGTPQPKLLWWSAGTLAVVTLAVISAVDAIYGRPWGETLQIQVRNLTYQLTTQWQSGIYWWSWPIGGGAQMVSASTAELISANVGVVLPTLALLPLARQLRLPGMVAAIALAAILGWGLLPRFNLSNNMTLMASPIAVLYGAAMVAVSHRSAATPLRYVTTAIIALPLLLGDITGRAPLFVAALLILLVLLFLPPIARQMHRATCSPAIALLLITAAVLGSRMISLQNDFGPFAVAAGALVGTWASGGLTATAVGRRALLFALGLLGTILTIPAALGLFRSHDVLPRIFAGLGDQSSLINALAIGPSLAADRPEVPFVLMLLGALGGALIARRFVAEGPTRSRR